METHGDECSQCQDSVGVCNDTDYQVFGCGLRTNSAANEQVQFEAPADGDEDDYTKCIGHVSTAQIYHVCAHIGISDLIYIQHIYTKRMVLQCIRC